MAEKTDGEQTGAIDARNANPADAPPIRSSFSIDRYSREAIRRCAELYGVTQGDVVNLAPLLYALVAERSLQRRRENLDAIKTLVDQAELSVESIRSVAPHLEWAVDWLVEAIRSIYKLEAEAIDNRDVHGVVETCEADTPIGIYEIGQWGLWESERDLPPSPFIELLKEFRTDTDSEVVTEIKETEPEIDKRGQTKRRIDFQCFEKFDELDLKLDEIDPLKLGLGESEEPAKNGDGDT